MYIPDLNTKTPVRVTSVNRGAENSASGIFSRPPELIKGQKIRYLILHLTGFPKVIGEIITDTGSNGRTDRSTQISSKWRLTLDALPDLQDTLHQLKDVGGYAVTHVGRLEKKDGDLFSSSDAKATLENLYWYLSFLRGLYCRPILVVGFDKDENRIWEYWNVRGLIAPWQSVRSWLPLAKPNLDSLFNNFLSVMEDEVWSDVVRTVVNWYLESQTSNFVQQGIIWAQLGLEALAWAQFADKYISRDGFERLPLGDRLRLLLTHSQIPVDIPDKLKELEMVAKEYNWNGPGAIAELRNKIVHPNLTSKDKDKLDKLGTKGKYQIQELGRWYLELALLQFFDYSHQYHNRLDQEAFDLAQELVPWAKV